ncbi:MAG TPA: DNA polymerase III subunit alpha [Actinomycetota bacterium]|nr:DNA polymerase III subunit alpha [Actinomycetota bacterium]
MTRPPASRPSPARGRRGRPSPGRPFVHLDVRSYFSLREGAFSPEDLARRAAELGMPAVALTDRDGLYGAPRFVAACAREGVRPVLGATLTVRTARGDRRVVLLARDARGYANLCRLVTAAHLTGERGDPALATGQVCERAEGLVCLLGPRSEPGALAAAGCLDAAREVVRPFREAFGQDLFVEVQHRLEPGSATEVRRMLRLAEEAGVPAVATNGVRYLVREDAFLADVLECMRELVPLAPHHVTRRNAEGYLKSAEEMRALFAERPDLCDHTVEVAERCRFDLELGRVHFPEFPTPEGRSAGSVLAERCWRGLRERGMRPTREVRDRLDLELSLIQRMGYAAYFLTVADIVADIRAMGIRCACRGSAAGSLVCYLTGISDVDPIRHGLLFERFLNPLRDELPDIDIDVESARRKDVYDAILSRYGEDRCACVAMVETYRARGAIREVGKALGLPEGELDLVAKAFPHIGADRVREAMERLPELRGLNLAAGQLDLLFRVVERLDGFPRHLALHPSGVVLAGHDLPDRVPLERSFEGYRVVQADKDDVELLGLLKLDVLGVRMLSAMRHCLDEVARVEGEKMDLDRIPRDDPATFELIRASDTLGCFQIESPGQRELLQKFQPTRWEDLIVDISLFRPGPVKSDMVTPFLNRRHGLEPPRYAHPLLRPVLEETYGVIVYHEQLMRTISVMTGCDLATADRIRRHLDDPERVEDLRRDFVRRAVERGVDREGAERVWREVVAFASFGFCKAHAAAFAVPTYQSAWLKAHYPAHFLAGVLTHEPGMYPRRLILEDARRRGIEVLPLDVNRSEPEYTVEVLEEAPPRAGEAPPPRRRYGIRLGLRHVKGISETEVDSILRARAERPFTDVGDVLRRTDLTRPVAEALAHAGAFDALPGARGTRRDRLLTAMTLDAPREGEQVALPLADVPLAWASGAAPSRPRGRGGAPGPDGLGALREYSDAERVRAELEVLGLDATRHLLDFYWPLLRDLGVTPARRLGDLRGGQWVMVAGVKVASQTPAVRSGQRIIFLTLDDGTGLADVTVLERVQPWCARAVFHGFLLAVWGRLRRTGVRGASIIAEQVWDLAALGEARREGRLAEALARGAGPAEGPGRRLPARKVWHASGGSAGW